MGKLFISENLSMAAMAMWVYSLMSSSLMELRRARAILLVESLSVPNNFWMNGRLVTLPMNYMGWTVELAIEIENL